MAKRQGSPLYRLGFRGWPTLLKLAGILVIEVVIVFGYLDREAIDHYALDPMIAVASALPLLLAARILGLGVREELLISYLFLNFARIPDYLFEAGIEAQKLDERLPVGISPSTKSSAGRWSSWPYRSSFYARHMLPRS